MVVPGEVVAVLVSNPVGAAADATAAAVADPAVEDNRGSE